MYRSRTYSVFFSSRKEKTGKRKEFVYKNNRLKHAGLMKRANTFSQTVSSVANIPLLLRDPKSKIILITKQNGHLYSEKDRGKRYIYI